MQKLVEWRSHSACVEPLLLALSNGMSAPREIQRSRIMESWPIPSAPATAVIETAKQLSPSLSLCACARVRVRDCRGLTELPAVARTLVRVRPLLPKIVEALRPVCATTTTQNCMRQRFGDSDVSGLYENE